MKQRELVRILLHRAAQDEAAMAGLLQDPNIGDEIIGFHAQQAVEKALKAWLSHLGVDYPKSHNLQALVGLLKGQGQDLPPSFAEVAKLTPFGTVFRYEDLPFSSTLDRAEVLRLVQGIRAHVGRIVG
ncbi:MAG: HEPN domain-containing protein [Planctomycetota bacterium]